MGQALRSVCVWGGGGKERGGGGVAEQVWRKANYRAPQKKREKDKNTRRDGERDKHVDRQTDCIVKYQVRDKRKE